MMTCRIAPVAWACCLGLAGCESSSRPAAPTTSPERELRIERHRVELTPDHVDLGMVPVGRQAEFRTTLVNRGDHGVEIQKIEAHCGCAEAKVGTMRLQPGEQTELLGVLRAGNRPQALRTGVTVVLAGHAQPSLHLKLTGTVEPTIRVSGELTLSPDSLQPKPASATLMVHNQSAQAVELTGLYGLPAGVRARIAQPSLPAGAQTQIAVECEAVFLTDQEGEILMITSHALEESVPIRYRIRPAGALSCVPPALRLGVVSRQELLQGGDRHVVLRGESLQELELGQVEVPKFVRFVACRTAADGGWDLSFRFVDSPTSAIVDGVAVIHLAVRGTGRHVALRLPISGIVRDASSGAGQ
jgi:hypothetical protein